MTGLQVWLHPSSRTVKQFRVSSFEWSRRMQCLPHTRNLKLETGNFLYAASLRRTASVMRNRREVFDGADFDTGSSQRADRRFATRSRTAYPHIHRAHAVIARHVGRVRRGVLRSEWRSLARSAEAERARALPRNHIPRHIGDGHDGVIERRLHMHKSVRNVLALFLLERLLLAFFLGSGWAARCCWFCHDFKFSVLSSQFFRFALSLENRELRTRFYVFAAAFFLFATVPLRGPFRVRALVCVRCPRTGRLRRCRYPRYEPISISRLMFICTSLRRSPSTMPSASITWRMRLTSSSLRSWTFFMGSTLAWPRMRAARGPPIP